jgi:hypothetical protein
MLAPEGVNGRVPITVFIIEGDPVVGTKKSERLPWGIQPISAIQKYPSDIQSPANPNAHLLKALSI